MRPSLIPGWRPPRINPAALRVVVVTVGLLVAGYPWPPVRRGFASAYAAVADTLLSGVTFGRGGRVRVLAGEKAPDGRKPEGEVSTDAIVQLTIDHRHGSAIIGVSARRDAYLPLLLLGAVMAAAPLSGRSRLRLLLLGALVESGVILISLATFVVWNFGIGLGISDVLVLSGFERKALDLVFRTLLLPPGNRFIIPLFLAGMLIWFDRTAEAAREALAAPAGTSG